MHVKESVLSADDWASLRVVIIGPHMARRDQNFLQYFSRLLQTPKYANRRVVYYEGDDIEGALDLVGVRQFSTSAPRSQFSATKIACTGTCSLTPPCAIWTSCFRYMCSGLRRDRCPRHSCPRHNGP
jgi:hypothetical protein